MERSKFEVWLVDLGVKDGTELGKIRPCVIVQSNFLNHIPSTLICPFSSTPWHSEFMRLKIRAGEAGLKKDSVILVDQIRALDNSKMKEKVGILSYSDQNRLDKSLGTILDLT